MTTVKRKLVVFAFVACMLFATAASSFAATNKATIATGEPWKFSAGYFGPVKVAYLTSGWNSADSTRSVYMIHAVYSSKTSAETPSNYAEDNLRLVKVGKKLTSTVSSSTFSTGKYFRALLNPYGTNTTGCYASVTQSTTQ